MILKQVLKDIAGGFLITIGIVGLVTPILPGTLLIIAGLIFINANFLKKKLKQLREKLKK